MNRPAGYAHLIERYKLKVLPNWHVSTVLSAGIMRREVEGGQVEDFYTPSYWPGEQLGDHLLFALKYDGVNLGILQALFEVVPETELLAWVAATPNSKYTRRVWFLYEFLMARTLPLEDLRQGNYVTLLEPELYFTLEPGRRVARMRIVDNLLGGASFCPIVRHTTVLQNFDELDFERRCDVLMDLYPVELLKRAQRYLYTKETKSSFEIERVDPSPDRIERFANLLEMAEQRDYCDKAALIEVQNHIVDPRFRDDDYRTSQNYIGETLSYRNERIHYICPKPGDLAALMAGLLEAHQLMQSGLTSRIVHAAVISYGFVFLHPFEDGNGRIHRFLIHNILALRGLTPRNLIFPVSAAMQKAMQAYDRSLEAFSRPLATLLKYALDEDGQMTVEGATDQFYRLIDMTAQAEALCAFIQQTFEHELIAELRFLANYDKAKRALRSIVDMPDRLIDLFIRICHQNQGRLSTNKRVSHFHMLTEAEVAQMEQALDDTFAANADQVDAQD